MILFGLNRRLKSKKGNEIRFVWMFLEEKKGKDLLDFMSVTVCLLSTKVIDFGAIFEL